MDQKEIIRIEGLTKRFSGKNGDVVALEGIDLSINQGEIFGIIGLSGAGKSTLVRCMNLLERPTEGRVFVDGQELSALTEKQLRQARRGIGMIFQQFNLLMQSTAIENICFPLLLSGVNRREAEKRALELLEIVGLSDRRNAYPAQLSGGQKQRIAIAGVLAMRPQCIVLDEATAMLDPIGRSEVISTIERLNRDEGITVVLITHHMNEAEHADRVIVMNEGRVAMDGAPREVFAQVEKLKSIGLTVPDTVELLYELRGAGCDLPLTAITVDECADAIARCFGKSAKEDN